MVRFVENFDEFNHLKGRKDVHTIFDFTASWCGPCQRIGPVFEALCAEFAVEGKLEFYKVDVDVNSEATVDSCVSKMPTFHVYNCGSLVYAMEGSSVETLRSIVERTSQRAKGVVTDSEF